jgi:hypothetical protein
LRVELATGDVGTISLKRDGSTTFSDGKQRFRGSWRAQSGGICLSYPKMLVVVDECFTYSAPLQKGIKTAFRSTGGETVWVTMM